MIYDIHAHIIGLNSGEHGNYLCPPGRRSLILKFLLKKMRAALKNSTGLTDDEVVRQLVAKWVNESQLDRVVLLALDGIYTRDGKLDLDQTQLLVSNDYVADFATTNPKLLFGASVHPYRPDALSELDRVIERGACLIKWLPSAQNIMPDDPLCVPFYARMAQREIPLLCHTGMEHTLARFNNSLNNPRRLIPALKHGVTVIAAHCGTRTFPYERSYLEEWKMLAREHPNFYGDLSAFTLPLHGTPLRGILNDPELVAKVLYGSDFPILPIPLWYGASIGWRSAWQIRSTPNPFNQYYLLLKRMNVPEEVFRRAQSLLRL